MGIFGFLSKAHLDQAIPAGDVIDKVAWLDEQITVQRDNIETSRSALTQMGLAVDQTMARSTSEQGANRANQVRRSQTKERSILQGEISSAQQAIAKLNEERSPIIKELRKVEAEVGPIKYIAALIYGDTLDDTALEHAVRWMIILIVSVFDPLAIMLLIGCQHSFREIQNSKYTTSITEVAITSEIIANIDPITPAVIIDELIVDIDQEMVNNTPAIASSHYDIGSGFPDNPIKGQQFTRMDYSPARKFLFDGVQWIATDNNN
jgi:CRISPR/Cas system-associated endoribonuclease Cas2